MPKNHVKKIFTRRSLSVSATLPGISGINTCCTEGCRYNHTSKLQVFGEKDSRQGEYGGKKKCASL